MGVIHDIGSGSIAESGLATGVADRGLVVVVGDKWIQNEAHYRNSQAYNRK